jgi:Flp pilus assembly protein TadG
MLITRRRHDPMSSTRGQTLVEFALVLPLFLLMLFGLVDLGRFVFINSTLSQAAREGARLASVQAYWVGHTDSACDQAGGPICPTDLNALRANVLVATNRQMVASGTIVDANLHLSCDPIGSAPGGAWTSPAHTCTSRVPGSSEVSVRVVMTFAPITPVISQLFPSITSDASATMIIN